MVSPSKRPFSHRGAFSCCRRRLLSCLRLRSFPYILLRCLCLLLPGRLRFVWRDDNGFARSEARSSSCRVVASYSSSKQIFFIAQGFGACQGVTKQFPGVSSSTGPHTTITGRSSPTCRPVFHVGKLSKSLRHLVV